MTCEHEWVTISTRTIRKCGLLADMFWSSPDDYEEVYTQECTKCGEIRKI